MKDKNWSLQDMTRRFLYLAFVGLSLVVRTLCAEEPAIQRYLQLYRDYPGAFSPKGDWQQGEVEIIDDYAKMVEVQNAVKQRLLNKGLSEKEAIDRSRVGVIHEDAYWMWIRDAVIFPDGFSEIYNRFMHKNVLNDAGGSPISGVATLALFPNQKVLLNVIFRNGTRSWEVELPRGGKNKNETSEETACREVQEETGYEINGLVLLGKIPHLSGSMTNLTVVYCGKIAQEGLMQRDQEEVIGSTLMLSKQEIKEALCKGEIDVTINGRVVKAFCRDPFLSYALLLAESKELL